jgi:hypothetical protein
MSKCYCRDVISCDDCHNDGTITLQRIYTPHCQVCGKRHNPLALVYFVRDDNNLCCYECALLSGLSYEARIYKEGD